MGKKTHTVGSRVPYTPIEIQMGKPGMLRTCSVVHFFTDSPSSPILSPSLSHLLLSNTCVTH